MHSPASQTVAGRLRRVRQRDLRGEAVWPTVTGSGIEIVTLEGAADAGASAKRPDRGHRRGKAATALGANRQGEQAGSGHLGLRSRGRQIVDRSRAPPPARASGAPPTSQASLRLSENRRQGPTAARGSAADRDAQDLADLDDVRVVEQVRVGAEDRLEVVGAVVLAGDLRQRVALLDGVLAIADVALDHPRREQHLPRDLVQLPAVLRADLEDLDEQPVEREGGLGDADALLELGVLAGAAADGDEARDLVVALVDAVVDRRLEARADAADQHGAPDEIELARHVQTNRHLSSRLPRGARAARGLA